MTVLLNRVIIAFLIVLFFASSSLAQSVSKIEFAIDQLHKFQNVRDFCISRNNDEIYFTVQSPFQELSQILTMKKSKGKWSKPQLMPFSTRFSDLEPFLSPDQTKLFFASNRPLSDTAKSEKDFDIWYVERKSIKEDWSKPIRLESPVNTENNEFYPSIAANNNLYYTSDAQGGMGKDDIYFSEFLNGNYQKPQLLDSNINSSGYEFNAFVSQKEDFIIFTKYNSEGGFGSGDLFISTKDANNQWTISKNLGGIINTKWMEYCPFYDETNEVLYFTSKRNSIQPKKFKNAEVFHQYLIESENGLSKVYKVKLDLKQ